MMIPATATPEALPGAVTPEFEAMDAAEGTPQVAVQESTEATQLDEDAVDVMPNYFLG